MAPQSGTDRFPPRDGNREPLLQRFREPQGTMGNRFILRGCVLCDLCAERERWFGFAHDRAQWADWSLRPAMALAHGLTLAEGGNLRDGPWVPAPTEPTYVPCPTLGVDDEYWCEWIEKEERKKTDD